MAHIGGSTMTLGAGMPWAAQPPARLWPFFCLLFATQARIMKITHIFSG